MKKYGFSVVISVLLAIVMASSAQAGGLWLYEEATPDMGVGGAGRQAAGLDASTASGNPAAMTRLDRSQMEGGILGIYPDTKFDVHSATYGDNGGGNAGYFSPVPTAVLRAQPEPGFKTGTWGGLLFRFRSQLLK